MAEKINLPLGEIKRQYENGEFSISELSRTHQVSHWTIKNRLVKMGTVIKPCHIFLKKRTIKIPNEREKLGYIAGILDGEGTVGFHKNNGRFIAPNVAVVNSNKEVLNWLKNEIGGGISFNSHGTNKVCSTWQLDRTRDIHAFLNAIIPFLIIKRENARRVIDYCYQKIKFAETNKIREVD